MAVDLSVTACASLALPFPALAGVVPLIRVTLVITTWKQGSAVGDRASRTRVPKTADHARKCTAQIPALCHGWRTPLPLTENFASFSCNERSVFYRVCHPLLIFTIAEVPVGQVQADPVKGSTEPECNIRLHCARQPVNLPAPRHSIRPPQLLRAATPGLFCPSRVGGFVDAGIRRTARAQSDSPFLRENDVLLPQGANTKNPMPDTSPAPH
ncbi:hypothetical protein F5144DRAFT_652595 [Chaetomium tenue]|uniref:Uncharacterized protein n=1 Tax=Chaetomium tenue TaxID=1854479 RepID=A0ACB7P5I3_9PEZI|nr:hypothetical protein F5144DRAFT_652595 [Chaetomium globosum]